MLLHHMKKPCLAILAVSVSAIGLSGSAHAQMPTYQLPPPPPPPMPVPNSLILIENAAALNAKKAALKDFYAKSLYNPLNQFVNLDDKKLADAFNNNDYTFLLSYYQTRCNASDVTSTTAIDDFLSRGAGIGNCHNLGQLYQLGHGVPVDISRAISYYQMAADGGYWPSVQRLSTLYLAGNDVPKDTAKGIDLLVRYTTSKTTSKSYMCLGAKALGDLYRRGQYVARSGPDAAKWYGYCLHYASIDPVTNDRVVNIHPSWLSVRVSTALANMYADSDGPAPDPAKAVPLYQRLTLHSDGIDPADVTNARVHLGQLYVTGSGIAKDTGKGVELLQRAVDAGKSADAALTLAKLYTSGDGVPADPALAAKYLLQAANARNAEAQYLVGETALNQTTPDVKEGISWLQSAAILGYAKAQIALGDLALQSGTEADVTNAYVWYDFATQNQDDQAVKPRDALVLKLTPDQMTKAKAMETRLKEKFAGIAPTT